MATADSSAENGPKIYGEVCYRKQRRKRQKLLITELLYEYAKNSTLHGLRYIVDRALQLYEKIFWLLTFLMSISMCFFLISKVYLKWQNSPVIVSFSEKIVPVGDVAPSVDYMFTNCFWRGIPFNCSEYFVSVLTFEGICYNFNSLAADEILRTENLQKEYRYLNAVKRAEDWTVSEGYTNYRPNKTYPKRGIENTASPDLMVLLQEDLKDRDRLCNSLKSGYKIFVQHPTDLPQSSLYYYAALPGQTSSLALKFSMVTTDEGLRGYTPKMRQCYFPEDKELRYFRIYTTSNCKLECQSNYTFNKCGCVWFHMPHDDSRQLCISRKSYNCMTEALDKLSLVELKAKQKIVSTRSCECLPSCNSVQYDAEILKTNFNANFFIDSAQKIYHVEKPNLTSKNYSQIEVYFKQPGFVSMRRSELFGITDFLANCGGLLGLFLGFSFLSLVEIFYFGTLRLYTILKRDLTEEKANRKKEKSYK